MHDDGHRIDFILEISQQKYRETLEKIAHEKSHKKREHVGMECRICHKERTTKSEEKRRDLNFGNLFFQKEGCEDRDQKW